MGLPRLAMCNFIPDGDELRRKAFELGFSGVDWTFSVAGLPWDGAAELELASKISALLPLEVRYHCAFTGIDLGDQDDTAARDAMGLFRKACRVISRLNGRFMTVHLGLGRDSTLDLSWERTLGALSDLVSYAAELNVQLCVENLALGWSSRPDLFEKLIRKSGAAVTLDIGHATVSPSIDSGQYEFKDFLTPHRERVLNAHIYHLELNDTHLPPDRLEDVRKRLDRLSSLPGCDWWVLELREEEKLIQTLKVVREYLDSINRAADH